MPTPTVPELVQACRKQCSIVAMYPTAAFLRHVAWCSLGSTLTGLRSVAAVHRHLARDLLLGLFWAAHGVYLKATPRRGTASGSVLASWITILVDCGGVADLEFDDEDMEGAKGQTLALHTHPQA